MKKILIGLGLIVVAASCSQNPPQQNNVTIQSSGPAGFDVNKLAQLVKTSTDPQTLEKAINDPNNHINNLDLDKDGNIDYLKVEEPGQNRLNVVDDVSDADSVTVARINIEPNQGSNTADLSVQGNPNYAGYNNYYHSSFTDFLLLSYLMRPHPYYMPMYHYGYYPSYYIRVRTVTNFRPTTSSSMSSRSSRSSLSSPTHSQRSFSRRSSGSTVRSGGFGHSGSSSHRSSGFGRSRGGFGRRR